MSEAVEPRLSFLLAEQAQKIAAEIDWIDKRLLELGDSEEDRVEAIVLRALRRHLMRELREILWAIPAAPLAVHASPSAAPAGSGAEVKA